MGPRPREPGRLPRRLRPRRGSRSGGVRDRRRALAARRHARQPGRLARRRPRATGRSTASAASGRSREGAPARIPSAVEDDRGRDDLIPDERLELIFTCCHPALSLDAQVALTLRTLGGLTTDEIARAFLVPGATMAQRLVRAKRKIRDAGDPVPRPARPPAARAARRGARRRLPDLQRGLRRPRRPRRRGDPARPRARRADAGRARGTRAARADAAARRAPRGARSPTASSCCSTTRTARSGTTAQIAEGRRRSSARSRSRPRPVRRPGRDRRAPRRASRATGPRSRRSTASSRALTGSPVVELNRAVAVAEADGPRPALALVDRLDLDGYHYFHATRADLLRRLGRTDEAARLRARARARARRARAAPARAAAGRARSIADIHTRMTSTGSARFTPQARGGDRRARALRTPRHRTVLRLDAERLRRELHPRRAPARVAADHAAEADA